MIYAVPKGRTKGRPAPFALWDNKTSLSAEVAFTEECKLNLDVFKQGDNVLFGIKYLSFSLKKCSVFFGFFHHPFSNVICLEAVSFVNGVDETRILKTVQVGEPVRLDLLISHRHRTYYFHVDGEEKAAIQFTHNKRYSYPLGLKLAYPAPHDVLVDIKYF